MHLSLASTPVKLFGILLLLQATVTPARAADKNWYVGAAYAEISRDPRYLEFPPSLVAAPREDQGFKLLAGWRATKWLALEAAYLDLGSQRMSYAMTCPGTGCPISRVQEGDALSLSAMALLPMGPVDLFGRAGIARWTRERTVQRFFASPTTSSEREDVFTYGAGLQYRIRDFTLRVEHEILEGGDYSAAQTSVGLSWAFL